MSTVSQTGTRRRRRDERREETRLLLLQAAAVLFARRGYDGVSLDAVADEAGFTKGAVYSHFSSKHDLLAGLLAWHSDRQFAELRAVLARPEPLDERVRQLIAPFFGAPEDMESWCLLFVELWLRAMREPSLRPLLARLYDDTRSAVAGMIEREAEKLGLSLTVPAEDVAQGLLALGDGLMMRHVLTPSERTATTYRSALHALFRAATRSPEEKSS